MILVKNLKFCERFVLYKIHPEKVFGDVLVKKTSLSRQYKQGFKKKGKIGIFAKEIVHDFGQKIEVFSSFVFIKNRSRTSVC